MSSKTTSHAKNKKNSTKNSSKNPFFMTILVAAPFLAVVAFLLVFFLIPRYEISINDAQVESILNKDGIKTITAVIDIDCNMKEENDYYVCEDAFVEGKYDSNQDIEIMTKTDGFADNLEINDKQIKFRRPDVKIKKVVIREKELSDTVSEEYVISMVNKKDNRDVVNYDLTINTKFTSDELAKINKNPTGEEIASALKTIETIDGVCIVTEDNDPNGNLNKTGGYVAAVYFSDKRADLEIKNNPYANYKDVCDHGTSAGGQIEVYSNTEDANKRNDYLKGFDGGILSNGEHSTHGNAVFRISEEMPATQMKDLENRVIKVLTQ